MINKNASWISELKPGHNLVGNLTGPEIWCFYELFSHHYDFEFRPLNNLSYYSHTKNYKTELIEMPLVHIWADKTEYLGGLKIVDGPQGTINKYLITNVEEKQSFQRGSILGLGKFVDSAILLINSDELLKDALIYQNELIAKKMNKLEEIQFKNRMELIKS